MDILEKVIFSLSSDEVRRFKILSNRFKAEDEKKLLILFDLIRSDKYTEDEQHIIKELYEFNNAQTRNRYYRLRNKLLENIEKSLTFYHFKYKDSIHAYYDIQLSIMFRERGGYQLALYFLKKAEKKAKELDQFNILEQIYHEYTQVAMKDVEVDIEDILERRKANLEKVRINRKNSEAIAMLTQHLKRSNFAREKASVIELLEKAKKHIEASAEIFHSTEGRIQIFRIVSALLLQKEAYDQLVEFSRTTLQELEAANQFSNDNHGDRLFMRLWLINSLYKTCRFAESATELEVFQKEMLMYRKQNYFTYLFHFTSTRVNVLKCLGKNAEADKLLKESLEIRELRTEPEHEAMLLRSLADAQFLEGNYLQAAQSIVELKKSPGYEHFSADARMFLDVFEMVVQVEAGNVDFLINGYSPFKKEYRKALKSELHERVGLFLDMLLKVCTVTATTKKAALKAQLSALQAMFGPREHGNNEIILYDIYLLAKINGATYYKLFLEKVDRIRA